jgi:hypothetical protein
VTLLADALSLEAINTAVGLCTLLVLVGTAIAGLIQVRHLRASNELEAILTLSDQMREAELQRSLRYVQLELEGRLAEPAYRAELAAIGYIDPQRHPEMDACNWFNQLGTLVKNRLIDRETFLELYARLVAYYWERLTGAIALLRRSRGPTQYENFEYLALLSKKWIAEFPNGAYPPKAQRLEIVDVWLDADAAPRPGD